MHSMNSFKKHASSSRLDVSIQSAFTAKKHHDKRYSPAMSVSDWILTTLTSTTASTILIGVSAWLGRNLIEIRLKASVEHDFNQKLEEIRTNFRKSEESFKADLRAKESQIAALQTGALSGMVSRQAALDKRRLEAIDQLWAGVEILTPFKLAAIWLQTFDFVKSLKEASQNQKVRELFIQLAPNHDIKNFPKVDVHRARPFVSEMAWALFAAYQAILAYTTLQLNILKIGQTEHTNLLATDTVSKLVLTALPSYSEYIEKHGDKGYPHVVEPLEAALLKELQRMMRGEESDKASVEQAARIMQAVTEVMSVNAAISKCSST